MAADERQNIARQAQPRSGVPADETVSVVATPSGISGGNVDAFRSGQEPQSSGAVPADARPALPALKPGDRLGGCEILSFIAAGGMGEVYEGRHATLERRVAIKLIRDKYAEDPKYRERFLREAKVAARFTEPNIAMVFDAGEEGRLLYVVFEFIEGEDVGRKLRRGPLSPVEALRLARDVAAGLVAAHAQGVIHRDVKPSNIMVTAAGVGKLTDFGLVRIMHAPDGDAGSVIGTPQYMSPEQWQNKELDGRADLYSLGVTLYEMLCGSLPVGGSTLGELCSQSLAHQLVPLRERHAGLDPQIYALVESLLLPLPERIASAREVIRRIDRILSTLPLGGRDSLPAAYPDAGLRPSASAPATLPTLPMPRRKQSWGKVAAVLFLLGLGGFVAAIWPVDESQKERVLPPVQVEWAAFAPAKTPGRSGEEVDLISGRLNPGDRFQLHLAPQQDCCLYLVWLPARGAPRILLPVGGELRNVRVSGNREIVLPGQGEFFGVDEAPGPEALYLVASYEPVEKLSRLLKHSAATGAPVSADEWLKALAGAKDNRPPKGYSIDTAQSPAGLTVGKMPVRSADGHEEDRAAEIVTGTAAVERKLVLKK